jgi:formyltetrahydrofolate-dependent phosphoribosylglycinamide formyltransferase
VIGRQAYDHRLLEYGSVMPFDPLPIAFLLSGSGTTLQNFIDLRAAGALPIDIKIVISSRDGVKGLQRAEAAGIPSVVVPRAVQPQELFSKQITQAVLDADVKLVCMGGFLSMWVIPPEFEGRVMNVHPALLPSFGGKGCYGNRVHQAVLDAGCKVSGCTVHFADNIYDHGPIILQTAVPVKENDTPETLGRRVRKQERMIYPEAVRLFAADRLRIEGRRVKILDVRR